MDRCGLAWRLLRSADNLSDNNVQSALNHTSKQFFNIQTIIAVLKGPEVVHSNESVIINVHYLYKNPKKSKRCVLFSYHSLAVVADLMKYSDYIWPSKTQTNCIVKAQTVPSVP